MGSALSSFNRSELGAFRRSALGARGGVSIGTWFYGDSTVGRLYSAADGINFADVGFNANAIAVLGPRLFCGSGYVDSPYTSQTAYSGLTGTLNNNVIESGSALLCMSRIGVNADSRIVRSTDGGATWATITHPNTSSGGTFVQVNTCLIKTSTGRLIAIARNTPGNGAYPIYSDDDGASWTGGALITTPAAATMTTANHIFFCRSDGSLVFCRGDSVGGGVGGRTSESTDDGATFTGSISGLPLAYFMGNGAAANGMYQVKVGSDCFHFSPKAGPGHLYVIRNDGASGGDYSVVSNRGVGFLGPDNNIYSVLTSDSKLYSSPKSSLSWTLIVTSPTTLALISSGGNRLCAIGQQG